MLRKIREDGVPIPLLRPIAYPPLTIKLLGCFQTVPSSNSDEKGMLVLNCLMSFPGVVRSSRRDLFTNRDELNAACDDFNARFRYNCLKALKQ